MLVGDTLPVNPRACEAVDEGCEAATSLGRAVPEAPLTWGRGAVP
jgi:hypothetical protein